MKLTFRRALKTVLISLVALLALVFSLLLAVWIKPEAFISLEWVRKQSLDRNFIQELNWDELKFKTQMPSFFSKRIELSGDNICASYNSESFSGKGCIENLNVDIDLSLNPFHFKLQRIRELRLIASHALQLEFRDTEVKNANPKPDSPTNIAHLYQDNFDLINQHLFIDIPQINVQIADFEMKQKSFELKASTQIMATEKGIRALAKVQGTSNGKAFDGSMNLSRLMGKASADSSPKADLKANFNWQKFIIATATMDFEPDLMHLKVLAGGTSIPKMIDSPLAAEFEFKRDGASIKLGTNARLTLLKRTLSLRNMGCKAQLQLIDKDQELGLHLECPVLASYPFSLGPMELELFNQVDAKIPFVLGQSAKLKLELESKHDSTAMKMHLKSQTDWLLNSETSKLVGDLVKNAEFKFNVSDWNAWTRRLPIRYTALPAPFNAMNGKFVLTVASRTQTSKYKDVGIDVDFKGTGQALSFAIESEMPLEDWSTGSSPKGMSVDFNLRRLALVMPRWRLNDPEPKLFPDSRFVGQESFDKQSRKRRETVKQSKHSSDFDLDLKLASASTHPVRIHTTLLDEDLRFYFNFDIQHGMIREGKVETLPLKTELFRRHIELKKFNVTWNQTADDVQPLPQVEGLINFPLPDYLVKLNVKGPMAKPIIYLESDPPLPQDDIYSVLIFGRPLSELQTEQKDSMAQAQQVLTQGFFSLTSLYFFGATPIEAVGYDPSTGQVSAQFKVSDKSSVKVGGKGQGVNEVSLRRSLGKGWYIESTVNKEDTKTQESFSTSVEKVIKY